MSTLSLNTSDSLALDLPRCELSRGGSFAFLALITLLAAPVFIMPLSESWVHSTYENYDNSIDEAESSVREGTFSRQIALGGLGLFGLGAMAWPGGKRVRMGSVVGILGITYIVWCFATCLWSDEPGISLRRCVALLCEVVAGLAIARRTSGRQFVWFVMVCTLAWFGLGLLAELSLGTFRPFSAGHRFAGVFHPNMMGVNVALLALAAYYLATTGDRRQRTVIAIGVIAITFLMLTRSRTSVAAMLLAVVTMWFFTVPTARKIGYSLSMTIVAVVIAMSVALGAFQLSTKSLSMGRNDNEMSSFTGRVPLWQELLHDYVPDMAMLGYGYGAFWSADRIAEISKSQNWVTTHAHSTYLDLVLNVGYVGVALCLAVMVSALAASLRREVSRPGAGFGFVATLIVFGLASGALETYIGHTWFLTFFGICGVCYLLFDDEPEGDEEARRDVPSYPLSTARPIALARLGLSQPVMGNGD